MSEITESETIWERTLTAAPGRSLLIAFWTAFILSALAKSLPSPLSDVLGSIGQSALAVIWIGYPIWLFRCFTERKVRTAGVSLLICCAAVGYVLSVFVYAKNGPPVRSIVSPITGAILIVVPFIGGAHALKRGERKAEIVNTANMLVTAVALFALPFFGSYVHERFRQVFLCLQRRSH